MNLRICASFLLLLIVAPAPATQELEGLERSEISRILDEAAGAIDKAKKSQQETAGALDQSRLEGGILRERVADLTTAAQTNLTAKLEADTRARKAEDSAGFWFWWAMLVTGAAVAYLFLRLHPATRLIVP